tara:strand:- start:834 stop:1166 length:333 start_codon:yes stop_codon:yes gene_type:complete
MRIKKNGKVVKLTESDLQRIVKRVLKENEIVEPSKEEIVKECILENTTLKDLVNIPAPCIQMIVDEDITLGFDCMKEMDSNTVQMIVSKIKPISKCVMEKMGETKPNVKY